ncbi:MAG: Lipopolysaccharide biosynthesis protein, partial [Candidatus Gallionella acididurans]
MTESVQNQMPQQPEDEIDLLDILIVVAKNKKMILRNTLVAALIAVAVSFLMPKLYTASTTIMPPQQGQSTTAAMLAQMGGLAGMAGTSLGIKNPADLYIGMLKSRTVADDLVKRFDL